MSEYFEGRVNIKDLSTKQWADIKKMIENYGKSNSHICDCISDLCRECSLDGVHGCLLFEGNFSSRYSKSESSFKELKRLYRGRKLMVLKEIDKKISE